MIEMKVMGIALDTRTGSPIVVLHDIDNRRALPIWIGSAEASSIIRKIENIPSTRPLTHDLFNFV
jgi:bifunctional DNase/RNase